MINNDAHRRSETDPEPKLSNTELETRLTPIKTEPKLQNEIYYNFSPETYKVIVFFNKFMFNSM